MAQRTFRAEAAGVVVYLVRHGRTTLNAAGVLRGRLDPPLDAVGRKEAAALAELLEQRNVCAVWTSPLRRALETAEPIATGAQVPVEIDDRLVDRDYGEWAGRSVLEIERVWGDVESAPGVEAQVALRARGCAALEDAARESDGSPLVVVSHDAVIRTVLTTFDPTLGDAGRLSVRTGSVNVLERGAGGWSVLAVNRVPGDDGAHNPVDPWRV